MKRLLLVLLFVGTCAQAQTGFKLAWTVADHDSGDVYRIESRALWDSLWANIADTDTLFADLLAAPFVNHLYRVTHARDTASSKPSRVVSGIYLPWCSDSTAACYYDTLYVRGDSIKIALSAVWLSHVDAWTVQHVYGDSGFVHVSARSVYDYNGDCRVDLRDLLQFIKYPYTPSDLVKLAAVFHKQAYYEWPSTGAARVVYESDENVDISGVPSDVLDALGLPHGTPPLTTRLGTSYPNPFSDRTTISYDLGKRSRIELCIYDISGKRIRVLNKGTLPAGNYYATWDGLDGHGRQVAGGIYFYRLRAGRYEATGKTVLVR